MEPAFINGNYTKSDKVLKNGSHGPCRTCNVWTSQQCKRCGDYYCSQKCQSIDWPNHRYICFPKPPLVSVKSSVNIEDDVYPVKLPGMTENDSKVLKELNELKQIILNEFQIIQCKLDNNERIKENVKSLKTNFNSNRVLDVINDFQKAYGSALNVSQDSGSVTSEKVYLSESSTENAAIRDLKIAGSNMSHLSINKSQLTASINKVADAKEQHVLLCAFRSTNRCAVRSKNAETENNFHAVTEKIDNYGKNAPQMETMPKVGAYAITLKSNTKYTRVKVLKCENEFKIRVVFCDYGNTVNRKLSDLRVIIPEITNLPEYVTTVQLHGVQMSKYTDKFTDFLKSFERKEYRIEYMNNDSGNNHVKLYDIETDQLLNELITNFCSETEDSPMISKQRHVSNINVNASSNNSHNNSNNTKRMPLKPETITTELTEDEKVEIEPIIKPPFKTHVFAAGSTNIKAVVVDTNMIEHGFISCISKDDLGYLSKIHTLLNTMDLGSAPYKPKRGEYCVAKYENEWYRGLVVTVVDFGELFEISYIDFLNEGTVPSESIRPYPKDLHIDCYTTLCKIIGFPKKLDHKQRNFLKNHVAINDTILIDRVVESKNDIFACIECSEIELGICENSVM